MAVQVSYPGVYIDEFAPGAPIQGVGTSTAAFIGPAASGDLDLPIKITSWDQFRTTFGEQPLPGFFLWYAVRGFFENGGQVCYVVRASNGKYGQLVLQDGSGNNVVTVRALQPGNPTTPIQVQVVPTHLLTATTTSLYQPTAPYTAITGREITLQDLTDAPKFRPGDVITIDAAGERLTIARVSGATIVVANNPVAHTPPGVIRLADAPAGTRTIRILHTTSILTGALVAGTVLTITQGALLPDSRVVESVQGEPISSTVTTYRVTFRDGLAMPLSLDPANVATVQSEEFNFVVSQGTSSTPYNNLSIDPAHPRYFLTIVNSAKGLVNLDLIEPFPRVGLPGGLLANLGTTPLVGGASETLSSLTDTDYINALDRLRNVKGVNLIAIPDRPAPTVQQAAIAQCEQLGDRFAVLDAKVGLALFGPSESIELQRLGLDSTRGYGALYYPWLRAQPAGSGAPILVPPSGHICGIIARSDNLRGVHKAPANEIVNGALGVERNMSDADQGQLNLPGINIIRIFNTGGRPVLWGARTTATDRNWQYVNIRRLFIFLEQSIEEGIRWAVFEPNNLQLWQKLKRTITEFLTRVWQDGALFGATAKEAFYVRIDETLNPDSERALGRLHMEIGVRPSYPAEFIIVRIGIWQGGSEVREG